jgi:hypothetical protein
MVEIRVVERSYVELLELKARVLESREELAREGIVVNSAGIRPSSNAVVVGLAQRTASVEADLRVRFGPGVEFVEASSGSLTHATPMKTVGRPREDSTSQRGT